MTEIPTLFNGAEPQFYRGNQIGCLVTHGFMATPAEVGWAGQHLAQQGYTVYVPRLTGHGINPDHMRRMRWQDWYAQALDGYHILRQQCDHVIVIGHSMGGLLSLLLAASQPVEGVAVVASPLTLTETSRVVRFARWIDLLVPFTEHPSEPELNAQIVAEQEQRGEPLNSRVHYAKWSSRAVHEFSQLENTVRQHLHAVTAPLLLLYAEGDTLATPDNAQLIAKAVNSDHIQQYTLATGGHIVFQDVARNEAFDVLANFVADIL
ncbi:MAG: alpha/beta fold hydrolase [Chloroflexota bacterium]